jgi:signal transduction histidine kinase
LASATAQTLNSAVVSTADALQEELQRRFLALASVAHELKTPLAIMAGYTELLLTGGVGPLNERQRQVLGEMQASGDRLQKFVEDFLAFSAVQTGKIKMNFEMGEMHVCLLELCSLWRPRFAEKKITLKLSPSSDLPAVMFDALKLQHIVSNLLHNALKFTPEGGTVEVGAEPFFWERRNDAPPASDSTAHARDRRNGAGQVHNSVRVWVSDTGPGIAPEYHQEIFEDFRMLPYPKRVNGSGTGLGLAIARRLVQAHSGKIWIESEPGHGSKLCFLVPMQPNVQGER